MDELAKAELESRSKAQVAGSLGYRHHRSSVQSTPPQRNSPRSAVQCSFRQRSAAQRSAALYGCFALQEPKAVAELAPLVAEVIPFQTAVDSTVPGHSLQLCPLALPCALGLGPCANITCGHCAGNGQESGSTKEATPHAQIALLKASDALRNGLLSVTTHTPTPMRRRHLPSCSSLAPRRFDFFV